MTSSTQDTKATGTQLLEQILEQISLQTDSLDGISARLDRMIDAVKSDDNQSNGQSESHNGGQSNGNGNIIEFDATEIVTTVDDSGERKLFRIKGGTYTTYGLRVWPEVIESFGLDPEELPLGWTPFTMRVRAQVGIQGKQKVISLADGGES